MTGKMDLLRRSTIGNFFTSDVSGFALRAVGRLLAGLFLGMMFAPGCKSKGLPVAAVPTADVSTVSYAAPLAETPPPGPTSLFDTPRPRSLQNQTPSEIWDLRIEDALKIAVEHSKVILDSGGRVLSAPSTVQTAYDPAVRETNPITGPAAALSAFDAQLTSTNFSHRGTTLSTTRSLAVGRTS